MGGQLQKSVLIKMKKYQDLTPKEKDFFDFCIEVGWYPSGALISSERITEENYKEIVEYCEIFA